MLQQMRHQNEARAALELQRLGEIGDLAFEATAPRFGDLRWIDVEAKRPPARCSLAKAIDPPPEQPKSRKSNWVKSSTERPPSGKISGATPIP